MRDALGLAEATALALEHGDDLARGDEREVVAAVAVEVADGERRGGLDGLARVDLAGVAELALALAVKDHQLGGRAVEGEVGLAVGVEVADAEADDLLVHRDAHQPHPPVVLDDGSVPSSSAHRPRRRGLAGLLGREEQVDPRPAVVHGDDVVNLVAVDVANDQAVDPRVELVDLGGEETEVVGQPGLVGGPPDLGHEGQDEPQGRGPRRNPAQMHVGRPAILPRLESSPACRPDRTRLRISGRSDKMRPARRRPPGGPAAEIMGHARERSAVILSAWRTNSLRGASAPRTPRGS